MSIRMVHNSHIMEFVWLQIQDNFIFFPKKPDAEVHMAGTVDMAIRIWVY